MAATLAVAVVATIVQEADAVQRDITEKIVEPGPELPPPSVIK